MSVLNPSPCFEGSELSVNCPDTTRNSLKPVNHLDSRRSNASKVPGASAGGYTSQPKYQVSDLHALSIT